MARIFTGFALACVVATAGGGCAEDCDTVEPAYAGEANDEVWRVLVGARADASGGGDAATITAPEDNAVLVKGSSPAISWDSPLQVGVLTPFEQRLQHAHRRRPKALFERLSDVLIPAAHAHLAPITSDVYFLELDVPGRTCPVALLTTETSATFSDDDWATIVGASGPRTLRLLSAFVTENRLTEGPFLAAPVGFTVE